MRSFRYVTTDVFTDQPLSGNPLAVVLDAQGLEPREMQAIATEFNYSETAFVLPPTNPAHTATVRIFTPRIEVPFAGHPNVGTAFVLGTLGRCGPTATFEEHAGLVAVDLMIDGGRTIGATITAPKPLSLSSPVTASRVAESVCLDPADIETRGHAPQVASVGLPFVVAELVSHAALRRAKPDLRLLEILFKETHGEGIHLYVRADKDPHADVYTRMFAPQDGVPEDPATGSANAALSALLAQRHGAAGSHTLRIAQGIEMGRPSLLLTEVGPKGVRVGGQCVMVMEGTLQI
jgi:trans-2,3-dihydro-3-hydroxyanthranilate isomerase